MKLWERLKIGLAGVLAFISSLLFLSQKQTPEIKIETTEKVTLPSLNLKLNNVSLATIYENPKNTKYPGNSAVFSVDGEEFVFDNIEIKGRGNTTWEQAKKPLQIKLDSKENLFGLKKAKTWILLANQFDDSHLRNDIGLFIARMLEEEYVTDGEFIELLVDDEWQGLYYLTHKVEISNGSVDLRDPYGVLFELDNAHATATECNFSATKSCLVLKDTVSEDDEEKMAAKNDFIVNFNELEIATEEQNWEKIKTLADITSFAEYYLISNFTSNPDAFFTSFYFYKNGLEDKIHAGPAWDFDFALNNYRWRESPADGLMLRTPIEFGGNDSENNASHILFKLMRIPEFSAEVKRVFREKLSGKQEILLERIDMMAKKVREVAVKNNEKWGRDNFDESVKKLRDWIKIRFNYFEAIYGEK